MPGASGEKYEDREDLQSSRQHIQDQDQLGQDTVGSKITGRANGFKPGSYIVKACKDGRYVGGDAKPVYGYDDETYKDDHNIGSQISVYIIQHFFSYHTVIVSYHLNLSGMDDLKNVPAQVLQKEEKTPHFKAAPGRSGTCPHQHEA